MQMRKGIKMRKMIILLLMAMGMGIYLYTTVDIHLLLSGATTSNSNMETFVQDQGTIDVYFCPREDCENTLIQFINTAEESVHCALESVPEMHSPSLQPYWQGLHDSPNEHWHTELYVPGFWQ